MPEEKKEEKVKPASECQCSEKDIQENKALAAIGYLGILFLVPLLAKKDSTFAQFHAKQGMALFVLEVVVGFVMIVPFLGWLIGTLGWLVSIIFFIMGLVNALGGKCVELPIIGSWFKNIKI